MADEFTEALAGHRNCLSLSGDGVQRIESHWTFGKTCDDSFPILAQVSESGPALFLGRAVIEYAVERVLNTLGE